MQGVYVMFHAHTADILQCMCIDTHIAHVLLKMHIDLRPSKCLTPDEGPCPSARKWRTRR